ncbi:hypothetical protein ACQEPB_00495 [Novosphingobium fluoreni]|uniref:hypothetical protein n=1 Tax=Novosphingobium fluoreni TaxID=1391222 RepID=UPI003DA1170A
MMWCEVPSLDPDAFWQHTPRSFQLVMRGVRKRMKREAEDRITLAWQTGAFTGATQSKSGLKPLNHYLRRPPAMMTAAEMLANMRALAGSVNSKHEVN